MPHRTQLDLLALMARLERPDGTVDFEDLRKQLGISSVSMVNRLIRLTSYGLVQPYQRNDHSRWLLTQEGKRLLRATAVHL
jgi:Mn-dependent DtxR family transcriptional regulator